LKTETAVLIMLMVFIAYVPMWGK